ncbi:hypothetical protein TNCV_4171181 [Trichonephila clavipes]|nr:hypothetical protein TNCV_4171181 [Trichonephila clavipes]
MCSSFFGLDASSLTTWYRVINYPYGFLRYFLPNLRQFSGPVINIPWEMQPPYHIQTCSIGERSGRPGKYFTSFKTVHSNTHHMWSGIILLKIRPEYCARGTVAKQFSEYRRRTVVL